MAPRAVILAIFLCLGCAPSFSQATDSAPSIQSHLRQAQEFLRTGRPDLAVGEFRAVLKLDAANLTARNNLGTLLYFQGEYEKATVELRAALKADPNLWKTQTLLGMSEKRIGHITSARADLEKSFPHLLEEKLRIQAGLELIEIDYQSRDLEAAAEVVRVLRRLKPEDPAILFTAHRIYSEQADEAMLGVSMLAPNSAWMHQLMAHELVRQGDIKGAIAHLREALKIDPEVPGLHFELAELLSASMSGPNQGEDQREAEKEYRAALAQNPRDEKAECRLGRIALKDSELKDGFAHYSRALELQPDDAEANLGLGRVLVAMDQPQKAQPMLEKAVLLDPSDAAAHFRLGTLYRQIGRPEDSRKELAEYQRLKQMKEKLAAIYKEMRLQRRAGEPAADIPQ